MISLYKYLQGIFLFINLSLFCQEFDNFEFTERWKFSLTIFGTRISSAELQNNISSPIAFIRDASIELRGGYGYGAELEFNPKILDEDISVYISSEFLYVNDDELIFRLQQDSITLAVGMSEKFNMYPVEAGLKWKLPLNLQRFKLYIGGGAGIYPGKRQRRLGYLYSDKISSKPGFSLNILTGVDFNIKPNISLNLELKFREGYFESQDRFNTDIINVRGYDFFIENPFNSRLLASGVRISLGLKYSFIK
ncbi:MAG: hypothetical protein N2510_09955 [Ignavibacteria bacterium]|nr:hypothetical protein [Ignavibacteria bacterium]